MAVRFPGAEPRALLAGQSAEGAVAFEDLLGEVGLAMRVFSSLRLETLGGRCGFGGGGPSFRGTTVSEPLAPPRGVGKGAEAPLLLSSFRGTALGTPEDGLATIFRGVASCESNDSVEARGRFALRETVTLGEEGGALVLAGAGCEPFLPPALPGERPGVVEPAEGLRMGAETTVLVGLDGPGAEGAFLTIEAYDVPGRAGRARTKSLASRNESLSWA